MYRPPTADGRPEKAWRLHVLPLLIWTLLWGLFFGTVLLGWERLPNGDFPAQFHAWGIFQAQELRQGRLPLWSPGGQGGFPFAADPQSAVFYPPRWLTILGFTIYDLRFTNSACNLHLAPCNQAFPFYALELEALLHIWLAGIFSYFLAHHITKNQTAALLTAVSFALGGYLTSYPLLQLAVLETITWLPLALWLIRQGTEHTTPNIKHLLLAGLVLALSALAGHPQTLLHISYLTAAYYVYRSRRAGWSWKQTLSKSIGMGIIVAGISAVAWLPAAHYLQYTTRSHVDYAFVATGQPLLNDLQAFLPGTLAFWSPEYSGMATLVLALAAWWGRQERSEWRGEILFWAGTAVLAAWIALGDAGVLFEAVYYLPGFSLFRQQERLMGLVSLSLALLAGLGWALGSYKHGWKAGVFVSGGLCLTGLILLTGPHLAERPWGGIWIRQVVLLLGVLLLLAAIKRGLVSERLGAVLFVLLLGSDLYVATYAGLNRQAESPQVFWPQPEWITQIQTETAESPFRISSRGLFHANLGEIYGLEDIDGISPLKPRFLEQFQKLPQARRWQLLGVRYILDTQPPEAPATPLTQIDESIIPGESVQATLYRFEAALPRAWMSYQPILVDSPEMARERMADPLFDPATQVVLHTPLAETIQPLTAPAIVQTRRLAANTLAVQVETAVPGILVISEWNYPGWQATLDGQFTDLFPADYALQGVLVPAGKHEVVLRFRPLDVMVAPGISAVSLLVALWHLIRHKSEQVNG